MVVASQPGCARAGPCPRLGRDAGSEVVRDAAALVLVRARLRRRMADFEKDDVMEDER